MHTTGANKVKLELVEHLLPTPEIVIAGRKLSDPQSYQVIWNNTFERDPS
jgi:hypothetical protein